MKFFHRLRTMFRKQELDNDLSDELAFHIEQETEENIAAGMPPDEARYAAIRKFGGIDQVKEECRDAWACASLILFCRTSASVCACWLRTPASRPWQC